MVSAEAPSENSTYPNLSMIRACDNSRLSVILY